MGCSVRILVGSESGPQGQRMVSAACRRLGPRLSELTVGSLPTAATLEPVSSPAGTAVSDDGLTQIGPHTFLELPPSHRGSSDAPAAATSTGAPAASTPRLRSPGRRAPRILYLVSTMRGAGVAARPAEELEAEGIGTRAMVAIYGHRPRIPLPERTMVAPYRQRTVGCLVWEFRTPQEGQAFRRGVVRAGATFQRP